MHAKIQQMLCNCDESRTSASASATSNECGLALRTVSHTLEGHLAERLRFVAYRERVSESAVIEFALRELFVEDGNEDLGQRMRKAGATLRRKMKTA